MQRSADGEPHTRVPPYPYYLILSRSYHHRPPPTRLQRVSIPHHPHPRPPPQPPPQCTSSPPNPPRLSACFMSRLAASFLLSTHSDHVVAHGTVARRPALQHKILSRLLASSGPCRSPYSYRCLSSFWIQFAVPPRTACRQHTPEPRGMVSRAVCMFGAAPRWKHWVVRGEDRLGS
jgi:hypothetical protein